MPWGCYTDASPLRPSDKGVETTRSFGTMKRKTLLIDADDTLWENNVFFENLIEDFISLVEPSGYSRAYIRHILNETERKNIRQYGYGVRSFGGVLGKNEHERACPLAL